MAGFELKSYTFRKEREPGWRRLEELIEKADSQGLRALTTYELLRLPILYRAALSSLSVARSISLDRNVVSYLEGLAARAYLLVYGGRSNALTVLGSFIKRELPQTVRGAAIHVIASAACMILGAVVAYILVSGNPDWYYTFVPEGMAAGRNPTASAEALRKTLFDGGGHMSDRLSAFASFLFSHNARIGMMAFALGIVAGAPTVLLMLMNGATLGAFAALFASKDLSYELWGWLLIHGGTELLAIILCGAGGLLIGAALLFPGEQRRLASLAKAGRKAAVLVIGAVMLLFVAAILEGFARQLVQSTEIRYLVAALMLMFWAWYFIFVGRERP